MAHAGGLEMNGASKHRIEVSQGHLGPFIHKQHPRRAQMKYEWRKATKPQEENIGATVWGWGEWKTEKSVANGGLRSLAEFFGLLMVKALGSDEGRLSADQRIQQGSKRRQR